VRRWVLAVGIVLLASSCTDAATSATPPTSQVRSSTSDAAGARGATRGSATGSSSRNKQTRPAKPGTLSSTAPSTGATRATWSLVTEPQDGMQPIYSLMSSARHELDMTMYELADSQSVAILEADAARGVNVRVILDQAYSGGSVNAAAYSALASHGVHVHWAPGGTIFHQKTITVDDHTSAIMTLNLTSEYYPTSRDFAVVTTDPSDVAAIEQVFATDWTSSGPPEAGPQATNLVWSPGAEPPILDLIGSATRSLLVENEEMDDPDVAVALEDAARRGVDVEVVMTYSSSWVSEFDDLVDAGVKVGTYSPDAPLYIHAKVIVADGATAFVGSQNFSVASLDYNRELGVITSDQALVGPVARIVGSDFASSTRFAPGSAPGGSSGGGPAPPPATTPPGSAPWCRASAAPANDGYAGDYDVYVESDQPDEKATASDAGDTYSYYTNGSGYAVIDLWHTSAGEAIEVTVGAARCSTTA
jgi:cardiolipin synthase